MIAHNRQKAGIYICANMEKLHVQKMSGRQASYVRQAGTSYDRQGIQK